jgi:CRISPR/Cas system Type II protein with McrA/HNH and RuvC-like nuclease domain
VRENNEKLAADRQLEEFLFGASRTNVAVYAERFYDMQDGRCFYSGVKLAGPGAGEVDHFIPWSRYPFDSPFNLVLASRKINNSMRDKLKPVEWRSAWLARNEVAFARLTAPEPRGLCAVAADANTAVAISEWIYRTTA